MHAGEQAAADWLLDCGDVARHEAAWARKCEEEAGAAEAAARERQRSKAAILERFDLRAVPLVDAGRKAPPPKPPVLWGSAKGNQQQGAPRIRYRDGQVVSTKGEKVIVESLREEWDGGSKGKVYTKGKRGKGFV